MTGSMAVAPTAHTMPDWLQRRALTHPDKPALTAPDGAWTFAELYEEVLQAAAYLEWEGVKPGDRVALLSRNSGAFAVIVHALTRLRAILVPLNLRLAPGELHAQMESAGVELLLADASDGTVWALAESALQGPRPPRRVPLDGWRRGGGDKSSPHHSAGSECGRSNQTGGLDSGNHLIDLNAPHSIIFTSGTTGQPKGAILTYGNIWWNAVGSVMNLGLHADDTWLACLPLFHVGGLSILMRSVIYGIEAIVHERFDAARVNAAVDQGRVRLLSLVSTMLERMLDQRDGQAFPPSLRVVLLGGGPVDEPLLKRALAAGTPLIQSYGMTETASQIATLAPDDAVRKAGSAGKPLLGAELRIDAPRGEVGDIFVRGPVVSAGYWGHPPGAHLDAQGWFRTGDLGYFDEEGYLYIVSRRTDLIISGGENIYPAEVEAVLRAHPRVKEAAVVPRPDSKWGQVPVAFVVLSPDNQTLSTEDRDRKAIPQEITGALREQLLSFCQRRLARYKVPVAYYPIEALPRNAGGKIVRHSLIERVRHIEEARS